MNTPIVSIIIPIYNVEKYIYRCIESVLNQSLKQIEIILVDDESPDNCPSICDDFAKQDSRIKVIHKNNEGLGFARNSGLKIATGEFVAFLDSDDYIDINMYENLYELSKDLSLDTVYCGYNLVSNLSRTILVKEVNSIKIFKSEIEIKELLLDMIGTRPSYQVDRKYQMSVWHAIYSKKIINKYNIKFISERKIISEDIIFHIDYLQKASRVGFTPSALYYYCSNGNSLTQSYSVNRFDRYKLLYLEILNKFNCLEDFNEYKLRASRLFIGYTRSLIFETQKYKISTYEKNSTLKSICKDPVWGEIFTYYPYKSLPIGYILVLILIKYKFINFLTIISKAKNFKVTLFNKLASFF